MVASALGGRVVYAWMWYWWMTFCLAAIFARKCVTTEVERPERWILLGLIAALGHFTYRVIWFLSQQSHRSLVIRVRVRPVFRGAVWLLPFLGIAALIAPVVFQ